jgi:hypothetical protein
LSGKFLAENGEARLEFTVSIVAGSDVAPLAGVTGSDTTSPKAFAVRKCSVKVADSSLQASL